MNYPLFIARRLSLSESGKKKAPAVNLAVAAMALSIIVMLIATAVVLGFKEQIREKVIGFNGNISLFKSPLNPEESSLISMNPDLKNQLDNLDFVKEYSLQASIPAIFKTSRDFKGIYLRGLSGDLTRDFLLNNLEEGEVSDFSDENNKDKIIISRNAANKLQLQVGDKIDTYFISDDLRVRRLTVAGIYNSHFDQYDDVIMFGALGLVQQMGGIEEDKGTYLQIATNDGIERIVEQTLLLQKQLNSAYENGQLLSFYKTDNVLSQGAGFFSWLSLLDTNVIVVIVLMIIVGAVTLISGMLIIIIEKKRFIGIMRGLGTPISKIRNIFIYLALRVAISGLIVGNIIGIALLFIQDTTHILPLDADAYYINYVPVYFSWEGIIALNIGVLIITYTVLILPSRFVSKISPAEIMRTE